MHTPSIAYNEYSLHRVWHPPKIVFLPLILMVMNWPWNLASSSQVPPYKIDRHHPSSSCELKGTLTLSHSQGCKLTNWWTKSQHPVHHQLTASNYSFNFPWLCPPSTSPISLEHILRVHLQLHLIVASKCMTNHTLSHPPGLHNHGQWVHLITHSITAYCQVCTMTATQGIGKLAWSQPSSAYA